MKWFFFLIANLFDTLTTTGLKYLFITPQFLLKSSQLTPYPRLISEAVFPSPNSFRIF
ncbi:hypothetical protein GILI108418_08950 [Gillisia limnaea]|uniref:Uncharacterized protein n=1 Tax=Gillisia limnaea (strain DSM 15749 / LMG 21470 / R-8282) TaxID=865937 RepID=H2BUK1_GILLR|nr:hypothetical protein Gilli_3272 [Gillisia limnaea DSM 15749]